MNLAEQVAAKMPASLIHEYERDRIRAINQILVEMGETPNAIRFLMNDEDFLPDALSAFRFRVEQEIISQERAF